MSESDREENHWGIFMKAVSHLSNKHPFAFRLSLIFGVIWAGYYFFHSSLIDELATIGHDNDYVIYIMDHRYDNPIKKTEDACAIKQGPVHEECLQQVKFVTEELQNSLQHKKNVESLRVIGTAVGNFLGIPILIVIGMCLLVDPLAKWLLRGFLKDKLSG